MPFAELRPTIRYCEQFENDIKKVFSFFAFYKIISYFCKNFLNYAID